MILQLPKSLNVYLQVLPTAAAGQVLHNQTVLSTDWRSILIPARATPAAVTATFKNNSTWKKLENTKMAKPQRTTGLGYQMNKAVTCQIKTQGGINLHLMKGVPLIPFSNTKLQISDLQATAWAL